MIEKINSTNKNKIIQGLVLEYWHTYLYSKNIKIVRTSELKEIYKKILLKVDEGILIYINNKNFIILDKRYFDSSFYKRNIWKISVFVSESLKETSLLLQKVEKFLKDENVYFVTLDIDASSINISETLNKFGFYIVASKLTNFCYTHKTKLEAMSKPLFDIELSKKNDVPAIKKLVYEHQGVPTLGRDSHFSSIDSREVYQIWVENACNQSWADKTYVARRNGTIRGFLSIRYDKIFEEVTGKKITDDSGLAFSTSNGKGAYINLLDSIPSKNEKHAYGFTIECNSDNLEVLNYCAKRQFACIGNRLIYHKAT